MGRSPHSHLRDQVKDFPPTHVQALAQQEPELGSVAAQAVIAKVLGSLEAKTKVINDNKLLPPQHTQTQAASDIAPLI